MPNEYQHQEVTGLIESITPKTNQNGKSFFEVKMNGNDYTIWEAFVAQQADAYQQGGVLVKANARAKVDNGRVSKFWTITALEPVAEGQVAPPRATQVQAPTALVADLSPQTRRPAPSGSQTTDRFKLLDLAISALRGSDQISDPTIVIAYAETLEDFILGDK